MPNFSLSNPLAYEQKFLEQFISIYQKHEALWRLQSPDYHNRVKKKRGYNELCELMRTLEPDCTVVDVKKRICSIRSNFRRELRKVQASLVTATEDDEIYVPKLSYFNNLLFLKEHEILDSSAAPAASSSAPAPATSRTRSSSAASTSIKQDVDFDAPLPEPDNDDPLGWESVSDDDTSSTTTPLSIYATKTQQESRGKKRRKERGTEDECDVIGRNIAMKLRSLPPQQKIHAEKLINDVLYEALMHNLSRDARLLLRSVELKTELG